MAVAIRLTRVGATKRPAYRVIAIDKRRSRDGRALEILGYYDPLTEPATVQLETDKIRAWIGKGAQPSETVVKLMAQAERAAAAGPSTEKPKRATRPAKPKASSKAAAKAAAKAEAPEAPAPEAPAVEAPATEAPDAAEAEAPEAAEATEASTEDTSAEGGTEETAKTADAEKADA
ncbi:MAG TPA: 30S ribosomal protein S16 [Candidatus Limnocylindria bacterium]|nr:30S ribosomal protein S16 [Candidatus Limnocylindria bacterium]